MLSKVRFTGKVDPFEYQLWRIQRNAPNSASDGMSLSNLRANIRSHPLFGASAETCRTYLLK